MKKMGRNLFIIITIILVISIFGIFGCLVKVEGKTDRRFAYVNSEVYFDIYYDKETKVMYAVSTGKYNYGNVVMLVDANGKPLLYGGE